MLIEGEQLRMFRVGIKANSFALRIDSQLFNTTQAPTSNPLSLQWWQNSQAIQIKSFRVRRFPYLTYLIVIRRSLNTKV
jgi:hypothetical protein